MPGPKLPPFLLPQAVTIAFTTRIFLGFYLLSLAFTNRWLILTEGGWEIRKNIRWFTLIATNIIAVLDEAVNMSTPIAESGFVAQGNKLEEYTEPPWRPIMRCILFDIISLLTDTVLMYRLWITYLKRMSVVWFHFFPLAWRYCLCQWHANFPISEEPSRPQFWSLQMVKSQYERWAWNCSCSVSNFDHVLNAYCTGLLIWWIRKTMKRSEGAGTDSAPNRLQFLIRVLLESGALYLSISIAHFLVYFGHDRFAIHMIGTLNTIVVGIAYNLIIVRVGLNRSEVEECRPSNGTLSTLVFFRSSS